MLADRRQDVAVHIRWMIRRDMSEVLAIENRNFEFAWSEEDFIRCLRQRNCIGMVAEHEERVVGFMIYELHKNRLHILNFAVSPGCHRGGVGMSMVKKLIGKLFGHPHDFISPALVELRRNLDNHLIDLHHIPLQVP